MSERTSVAEAAIETEPGTNKVRLTGIWTTDRLAALEVQVQGFAWPAGPAVGLDPSGIVALDTGGARLLHRILQQLTAEGKEARLEEQRAELGSLRHSSDKPHTKRLCQLRSSGRYGACIRFTKTGKPAIDKAAVRQREQLDGKVVVHSNDDTLSAEDMAPGYKQLQRVEEAWRTLKSGLRLHPVFRWTPHRISAHVSISVLALLLDRVAEQACADTRPTSATISSRKKSRNC